MKTSFFWQNLHSAPICKVFSYWCFNWPTFTRNAEVANSPIVKLMRVQNWTFIFPTSLRIDAVHHFLQPSNKCNSNSWIFPRKFHSIIFVCFIIFLQKKVVHAKEDVCAEICLGVNANLETSLKTKTCNWRKCTRWIYNIQTLPKWNITCVCLQIPTLKIFTRVRANSSFSIILQSNWTDSA